MTATFVSQKVAVIIAVFMLIVKIEKVTGQLINKPNRG